MRQQEGVLRRGHFAGMQPVVDPDHGLAVPRQGARGVGTDAAHVRQLLADVAIMIGPGEIGLGGDESHEHVVALGRLAGRVHRDAVRGGVELLEVALELPEVREFVVVARREPQNVARRRDGLLRNGRGRPAQHQGRDDQGQCDTAHAGV